MMKRAWINQPSKLQPHHKLHGKNVLMDINDNGGVPEFVRIYFLDGPVVSQFIQHLSLSSGWNTQQKARAACCDCIND